MNPLRVYSGGLTGNSSVPLIISNFALYGIPFLAGFYSKDLMLEIVSLDNVNLLGYFLFYFSRGLTVCYYDLLGKNSVKNSLR